MMFTRIMDDKQRILELEAQVKMLREALEEECGNRCNAEYNPCWAREILNTTTDPLDALAKYLAEVIEECAAKCERDLCNRKDDPPANYFDGGLRHCAAAIRGMK